MSRNVILTFKVSTNHLHMRRGFDATRDAFNNSYCLLAVAGGRADGG